MSRNYANISTAIWRNDEFRDLSPDAQWMYLLLTSQPDITAAGVLPLAIKRWSTRARGVTVARVRAALTELQNGRFVVFDEDTEELLVRSFVRWDGGHSNPKRRPVIQRAAEDVESSCIRRSLAAEFKRLGLPDWLSDGLPDGPPPPSPTHIPVAEWYDAPTSLLPQVNSLSDSQSDTESPSDGVVVTKALVVVPQPTTHNPQPIPASPGVQTANQRSRVLTNAYYAEVPLSNWNQVNRIVAKAIKANRWTDDQIQAALMRIAEDNRPVTTDVLRIELDGANWNRSVVALKPSTTDMRVAAALALGAELRASIEGTPA